MMPTAQAERGGDQRLRDAAGDHPEAARAGDRHAVEGAHDAHHRAEEADERRDGADRREHPEVRPGALRPPRTGAPSARRSSVGHLGTVRREHVGVDAAGGAVLVTLDGVDVRPPGRPCASRGTTVAVRRAVDEIIPRRLQMRSSTTPSTMIEQSSSGYVEIAPLRISSTRSRFTFSMGSILKLLGHSPRATLPRSFCHCGPKVSTRTLRTSAASSPSAIELATALLAISPSSCPSPPRRSRAAAAPLSAPRRRASGAACARAPRAAASSRRSC